jgi:hypothetical protein
LAVIVPFPEPERVTVHQAWSLDAVHAEFEVTAKAVLPAADVTFWLGGVTTSVGVAPLWVTVTVTGLAMPAPVTVMVAMRELREVFSV